MKAAQVPVLPLFVTETGEDSLTLGLPQQARCLDITFVRGASAKLKGIVWWTFKDHLNYPPPPEQPWSYGIVDVNFNPSFRIPH